MEQLKSSNRTVPLFAKYWQFPLWFAVWCFNTSTHKVNVFEIHCHIWSCITRKHA